MPFGWPIERKIKIAWQEYRTSQTWKDKKKWKKRLFELERIRREEQRKRKDDEK